jgi:uncharacterized protein
MTMKKTINTSLRRQVPCNVCRLCCQGDAVRLEQEDLDIDYQTEPHAFLPGALMLAHKANGECMYLGEHGCTIHDHAPSLCRIADCRSLAIRFDYETARKLHALHRLDIRVWDQGKKLIENSRGKSQQCEINHNSRRE